MVFNGVPYNHFIHHIVAVYQDISEADYAMMLGDMFNNFFIKSLDSVKRLADDFKVPLNRSLCDRTIFVHRKIHAFRKTLYLFYRLQDIKKVFPYLIFHRVQSLSFQPNL